MGSIATEATSDMVGLDRLKRLRSQTAILNALVIFGKVPWDMILVYCISSSAPVRHVREVSEHVLVLLGQQSRLLRRRQLRHFRREFFVKVTNILQRLLQAKKTQS